MDQGIKLKEERKKAGITIVELAEKTGISQTSIVRIERGVIKPTKKQIKVIQEVI